MCLVNPEALKVSNYIKDMKIGTKIKGESSRHLDEIPLPPQKKYYSSDTSPEYTLYIPSHSDTCAV